MRLEPSVRGIVRGVALAACLALAPGAAWAAQLVDVRVGRHDDFTRIVFELDAPAGYRIERDESAPGVSELVVTLEAGGASRRVPTPKSLVEGVSIDSLGPQNAVAHIRLASNALRLKEMILSGPPRIVLDVLPAESAKAPAPARSPAPRTQAKVKPAPPPAQTSPSRTPERAKRAATPAPRVPATAPDVPASAAPATPQPRKPPSGEAIVPREAKPPPRAEARPQATPQKQVAATEGEAAPSHPEELAMATPQERAAPPPRPPRASEPPRAASRSEERVTRPAPPPARRAAPEGGGGLFDARTLGLAAGGIFLLALGFVWLRRRRAESFEEEEGFSLEDGGLAQGEANPFDESAPQSAEREAPSPPPPASAQASTPARAEGESMETPSVTTDSLFSSTPSGAAAAAGTAGGKEHEDIMRLVRELERRVANLETRLDEAIDAKERMERQVAAQTEELRVQRAAIARTQRAVRNLSRPEEEHATEPALRDGEGPS